MGAAAPWCAVETKEGRRAVSRSSIIIRNQKFCAGTRAVHSAYLLTSRASSSLTRRKVPTRLKTIVWSRAGWQHCLPLPLPRLCPPAIACSQSQCQFISSEPRDGRVMLSCFVCYRVSFHFVCVLFRFLFHQISHAKWIDFY